MIVAFPWYLYFYFFFYELSVSMYLIWRITWDIVVQSWKFTISKPKSSRLLYVLVVIMPLDIDKCISRNRVCSLGIFRLQRNL